MNKGGNSDCQTPCETACEPECKPEPCETCTPVCCKPQADIESLHAVNRPCTTDIAIGYQVDTKHTCDDFDLAVHVEHCDKVIFERLIHLGHPYRVDADGDRHFHGAVYGQLPEIICANRDKLKVIGCVIPHGANGDTAAPIDREHERVHSSEDKLLLWARVPGSWPEAKTH